MKNFIIVALALVVVFQCFIKNPDTEYKTITNTILVTDSTYSELIDTLIIKDFPLIIDTAQVINDYYSKFNYRREYNDKHINIVLNDTIFTNKIYAGDLKYTIKNHAVERFYYGVGLDYVHNVGIGFKVVFSRDRFDYSMVYYPYVKSVGVGAIYRF